MIASEEAFARRLAPEGRLLPAVLIGWLISCAVLIAVRWPALETLRFVDSDDAMRLLEVRDWLAGQSWWDVSQHRLNGGHFAMHWSRLVDLPLAAVIAPLDPLTGPALATRVALVVVPLVTLLAVMALGASLARRVAGPAVGTAAILIAPLAPPLLMQVQPMRIDHHGWQVVLAMAATLALVARPTARTGTLAGALLGTLVCVSLEGLPIAVAIAGVAALGWAWRPRERRAFLLALVWTLVAAAALLHAATRGPAMAMPSCDAIAPSYLVALLVAAVGVTLITLAVGASLPVRLALLVVAAAAAGGCFALAAPACLAGPFAHMDPLVYRLWYLNVLEGRPIWDQAPSWAAVSLALPLTGLAGALWSWRQADPEAKERWALLIGIQLAAIAITVMVIRAGATANALAIPGAAALLLALLRRARAVETAPFRILATVGALCATSPGLALGLILPAFAKTEATGQAEAVRKGWHRAPCRDAIEQRAVAQLPRGTVFMPINDAGDILVATGQHLIGAPYHRNSDAIATVFRAFMGTPLEAGRLIRGTGAGYVAVCPGLTEPDIYRKAAPNGLWSRLERGERFDWLKPVPIRGSHLLAWRVVSDHPSPLPGAPARR